MSKGNNQEGRVVLWHGNWGVGLVIFNRDILPLAADVGTEIVFREPQLQSALPFYRSLTLRRGKIRLLMEMIAVKDRKKGTRRWVGFKVGLRKYLSNFFLLCDLIDSERRRNN